MRIESKAGVSRVDYRICWKYFLGTNYFALGHCFRCEDFFSELSDLSIGDAWLDRLVHDSAGRSLIIVRTNMARLMIDEMMAKDLLRLWPVSHSEVKSAFYSNIIRKKRLNKVNCLDQNERKGSLKQPVFYDKLYLYFENLQRMIGKNHLLLRAFIRYPPTLFMKCMAGIEKLLWFLVIHRPTDKDFFRWVRRKLQRS